MKELIEKQAVIDALLAKMDTIDDKPEVVLGLAVAMGMIKAMPSALEQEPCEDCISRSSIKQKLQEHHDFFVKAYGGFSNLPQNDKSRVDEITNCIAMVVNEPSVHPECTEDYCPAAFKPVVCKDCISRQAVLEIVEREQNKGDALSEIEKLSSVTTAEKVGYWTKDVNDARELFDTVRYYCSACGDWQGHGPCKYCPNCGAKMSESPTSCSTCILDYTDACTRGAGRAVDDEACEDYLVSPTGAEGIDKE